MIRQGVNTNAIEPLGNKNYFRRHSHPIPDGFEGKNLLNGDVCALQTALANDPVPNNLTVARIQGKKLPSRGEQDHQLPKSKRISERRSRGRCSSGSSGIVAGEKTITKMDQVSWEFL
jgi:hypothetical protein